MPAPDPEPYVRALWGVLAFVLGLVFVIVVTAVVMTVLN